MDQLLSMPFCSTIPRSIHQTYPAAELPPQLQANVDALRAANPEWKHHLYNDEDVLRFIADNYADEVLDMYLSIDESYGAARADLFRYLLIYKIGGVYLDIKSRFTSPLSQIIGGEESYILSQWSNGPGQCYEGHGLFHPELARFKGGELQQWHIIAAPGHPFLRAVLNNVLSRVANYNVWRDKVGKYAVLRVTGPIVYTLAIAPLISIYPCKRVPNEQALSLEYSVLQGQRHRSFFKQHYASSDKPLVRRRGGARVPQLLYLAARNANRRLRQLIRGSRP